MSTTTNPAPQTNPEHEQGVNSEMLASHRPTPPLTARIDEIHGAGAANGHNDEHNGGSNGTNGVHHHGSEAPVISGESTAADGASADEIPSLTNGLSTPRSAVKIKGRPGGVSLELGEGDWDELIQLLEERLNAAEGFFRGGRVVLDVGSRPLIEDHLRQIRRLLEEHGMKLGIVRSTAERTIQAALEVGVSITNEETESLNVVPEMSAFLPSSTSTTAPTGTPSSYAPAESQTSRPLVHHVHRGSLRSGQVLRKTESIVIIGDVNPGAQVISGGDIMVWGRLRGVAHAGADGNRRAVVTAIDFVPTQLRIATVTAVAPEQKKGRGLMFWKKEPERRPEIARIVDGRIVVEPWDESKPNGLGVWRK